MIVLRAIIAPLALLAASFGLGVTAASGAPGDLDPSFGSDGIARIETDAYSRAEMVEVASDGKIVAVGVVNRPDPELVVARYLPDGSLDPSFGDGGTVNPDPGEPIYSDRGGELAIDPDGNIAFTSEGRVYLVSAAGEPSSGAVCCDGRSARPILPGPGGSWIVAGRDNLFRDQDSNFWVARIAADGRLDAGFGDGGETITPIEDSSAIDSLLATDQGEFLGVGSASSPRYRVAIAAYGDDGLLDQTFAANGIASSGPDVSIEPNLETLRDPDGGILVSVEIPDPYHAALLRFNPDGSIDRDFGSDGQLALDGDSPPRMARFRLRPDQTLVGLRTDGPNYPTESAIVWLDGEFELDNYHAGGDGVAATVGPLYGDIAVQADGAVVAAGSDRDGHFVVARYTDELGLPDSDADSILDYDDGCPDLHAETADGCPTVLQSLEFNLVNNNFDGTVAPAPLDGGCSSIVRFYRVRHHHTHRVGVGQTDAGGHFDVPYHRPYRRRAGRYLATINGHLEPRAGHCAPTRARLHVER